jgi:hypothetical protein
VVGEIEEARAFTDKAGNNRASIEIKAQSVRFMDSKPQGGDPTDSVSVTTDEALPF